jgi:hypothetical protein
MAPYSPYPSWYPDQMDKSKNGMENPIPMNNMNGNNLDGNMNGNNMNGNMNGNNLNGNMNGNNLNGNMNGNNGANWQEQEFMKKHNAFIQSVRQVEQPHPQQQLLPPPTYLTPQQPPQAPYPHPNQLPSHPHNHHPKKEENQQVMPPKIAIEVHVSPPNWQAPSPHEEKKHKQEHHSKNHLQHQPWSNWQQPGQETNSNGNGVGTNQQGQQMWKPSEEWGKEQSNNNQNNVPPNAIWQSNQIEEPIAPAMPPLLTNRWQPNYEAKKTIDSQIREPLGRAIHWNEHKPTTVGEMFIAPPFTTPAPTIWQTIDNSNSANENQNSLFGASMSWQPKEETKKKKLVQDIHPFPPVTVPESGSKENTDSSNSRVSNRRKPVEESNKNVNQGNDDESLFESYMSQWANDRLSILGHVFIFLLVFVGVILFLTRKYLCVKDVPKKAKKKQMPCPCRPCPCQIDRIIGPNGTSAQLIDRKPSDRSSFTDRLQVWVSFSHS